jgi:hypothetical protein
MEEELSNPGSVPGPPPATRPGLLTVICILSLVNGGLTLISSLIIGSFFDQFVILATDFAEKFKIPGMEMITEGKPVFFFVNALLYTASITGVGLMFRLKKNGFHIYTISQILLILAPMYFYHLPGPSIFDIILSGTFVMLYYIHLKLMT